jgi:hypothetical protein
VSVLKALNIDVGEGNDTVTLNVKGSTKSIVIDLKKLREAITVVEGNTVEKEGKIEERKDILDGIDLDTVTEE